MVRQLPPLSLEDSLLYPESDGKPLADNTTQFRLIVTLQGGLDVLFQDREDVFVAGDLLWYPVQVPKAQPGERQIQPPRQAPDVMVASGRPKGERRSYKQWEEGNIAPQVVFEILSESNTTGEMQKKFEFYQRYGVEEYYLYDPKPNRLQGWERQGDALAEIELMEGWRSPRMGVRFSTATGNLELFHPNGERLASYVEAIARNSEPNELKQRSKKSDGKTEHCAIASNSSELTPTPLANCRGMSARLAFFGFGRRVRKTSTLLDSLREALVGRGIGREAVASNSPSPRH